MTQKFVFNLQKVFNFATIWLSVNSWLGKPYEDMQINITPNILGFKKEWIV